MPSKAYQIPGTGHVHAYLIKFLDTTTVFIFNYNKNTTVILLGGGVTVKPEGRPGAVLQARTGTQAEPPTVHKPT